MPGASGTFTLLLDIYNIARNPGSYQKQYQRQHHNDLTTMPSPVTQTTPEQEEELSVPVPAHRRQLQSVVRLSTPVVESEVESEVELPVPASFTDLPICMLTFRACFRALLTC